MSRRWSRARVVTAGAMTVALALTAAGSGPAFAAADPPALEFRVATEEPVVMRYVQPDGTAWMELDLGISLIAGRQPFEVRAQRRTYADPVVAQQLVTGPDGRPQATDLPAGLFTSFAGFEDFTAISIRDAAGAVVREYTTAWCPNSYSSVRTRPDAPPATPYPEFCGGINPFLLGAVWGVQAGWSSSIQDVPPDEWEFDLPGGAYRVTVTLGEKYRAWLGVSDADAVVTLNLAVVDVPVGAAAATPARAGAHAAHATEGDPAAQLSAYDPRFRPPAKVPAALAAPPARGPRPDLRTLPAWQVGLEQGPDGTESVTFAATVWNAGTSPLVVDGFRRTGEDLMDAYQYFYDDRGDEVGAVRAGTMEWDPRDGHLHWHFTDFARYNLLSADKQQVVRSGKEAFCLVSTDPVDFTLPRANWRPGNTDLASSCGQNTAVAVRQALDVGSGDTYLQYLPGQSLDVTGLPNGTYHIQVLANPENRLTELNSRNNASLRRIVLGGTPGKRTLRVPPVHGLDG